jgi:8-oxo-dGTP pyrophosphatase MutT (NUDIX family)
MGRDLRRIAIGRLLHFYWRFTRGLTVGVRALVLDPEGRVFLIRHTYTPGWHLPGGGVEPGETLLEALARELREEGNIELSGTPRLHGVFYHPYYSSRDHVAVYVVAQYAQTAQPSPGREIAEHGFFLPDALPPGTTSGTRVRIAEVLGSTPASERW